MAREVTGRMLWLAPPVIFYVGVSETLTLPDDDVEQLQPRAALQAAVLHVAGGVGFGVHTRFSRARTRDVVQQTDPYDIDYTAYFWTLDVGVAFELRHGSFFARPWFGVHAARAHLVTDYQQGFTNPDPPPPDTDEPLDAPTLLTGGIVLGVDVSVREHYALALFVELQQSVEDDDAIYGDDYSSYGLGAAVRF